ncbi:MAG: nitroreductase family protein [Burkholderiales bacterium]|jgi:nitroreductase|nr:nitroreductase family protein [Betaproteobacteria bacterium]
MSSAADHLSALIRQRRSVRDFRRTPIPNEVLYAVLDDANWSPSWSNTQPYRIAIASGPVRDQLAAEFTARFDAGMKAIAGGIFGKLRAFITRQGLPDGDVKVDFEYPEDLLERRRATGFGLYKLLGIERDDRAARNAQMRRNFEFFGAPTVVFVFVHKGLREFSALDAGIFLQTFMLSAEAHGLISCELGIVSAARQSDEP